MRSGLNCLKEAISKDMQSKLPLQRKTQRENLSEAISTILHLKTVNTCEIAAGLPRKAERMDMRYQWFLRLLDNSYIDPRLVMAPYGREVLAKLTSKEERIVLILDQTHINKTFEMLMLGVRFENRALPLAWIVKETQGLIGFKDQEKLLDMIVEWLPEGCQVVLMGDRAYGTPDLIEWCQKRGWDYRLRLKGNIKTYQRIRPVTASRVNNMGLKIYVQYNHTEDHIEYVTVDDATCNDVGMAQEVPLESNRIYVFDKGFYSYNWWKSMIDQGSSFVTRLKKNAAYTVQETFDISAEDQGFILKDQLITLSNRSRHRRGKDNINKLAGIPLRLIQIKHPSNKEKSFIIVTNAVDVSAQTIAGWYKERWSIELLFKWLKQNLKIKRFMGESRNAIMIQIYVAIIAYTLLKLYRAFAHKLQYRLKDISTLVRVNLFTRPKLQQHIRKRKRLLLESSTQLSFEFTHE